MSVIFDYVLVGVLAFFAGGWAIPAGVTFELSSVGVWAAASVGSSLGIAFTIYLGGRVGDMASRRFGAPELVAHPRARGILDRWGVAGLAVIGTVVLGPTLTVVAALTLGVDRRRFCMWAIAATIGVSTVITVAWNALL